MKKLVHLSALAFATLVLVGCVNVPKKEIVEQYVDEPIDFARRARLVNGPNGARLIFPDGLLFDTGMSALKPEAAKSLDACMFIIERSRANIVVEGHTDSTGTRDFNEKLSRDRAAEVRKALIERKVQPSRIEISALADTRPEVPNAKTPEELAQNRRAEVIFKGEQADKLDAPWGCGGPPNKRKIMVERVTAPRSLVDQVRDEAKILIDKATKN